MEYTSDRWIQFVLLNTFMLYILFTTVSAIVVVVEKSARGIIYLHCLSLRGLYLEIYGPTLIDLKIKLNANYEEVTSGVLGRSVGLFPGSVLGGVLVDKFGGYCHLFIALSLVIAGGVTVPVPLLPSVHYLWPLCFIGGLVESVINVAGQRIILNVWKEKSAAPMILLHAGYGIGSLLVPLYANPFLAVEMKTPNTSTNSSALVLNDTIPSTKIQPEPTKYIEESRIEYTYIISSIPVVLLSLVFFGYQVREIIYMRSRAHMIENKATVDFKDTMEASEDTPSPRSFLEMVDPATCAAGHRWYAIELWILLIFYFANAGGGERVIAGFVRSYSVDQLHFEKSDASLINTTFWISFFFGRLFFCVLARWISIRIIILIETGTVLGITILVNIFARNSTIAYWVLVQPLGFFLAPMWPSGVSWTDFHIELTGLGMMVILLGGSIGGTCHQRLIGYLYEHKGTHTFLYQIAGYGALAFILAIVLNLAGSQHGNRFKWQKSEDVHVSKEENIPMPEKAKDELNKDHVAHM